MKMVIHKIVSLLLKRMSCLSRIKWVIRLINLFTFGTAPKESLQFLLELDNRLYALEGSAAVVYGNGLHTKHKHSNYHQFFIHNVNPGERVLDIGCGNGFLSYDIVTHVSNVTITGIDLNEKNIAHAQKQYYHPRLTFIHGDAQKDLPHETFDVVTLSNVLEHIDDRVHFLKKIEHCLKPKRILIRVPCFERDWRVPLKKEIGVDYRLDQTHCIEYTKGAYVEEMKEAALTVVYCECCWGELWSVVKPNEEAKQE
ncbi:MAG: class I SAM-dependent methyltransferase [Candidatus Omnitrophica bacterium]|nr:class I SAM-dependent methyltransferase [Candidatus Omnitrophota bacterium]